MRPEHWLYTIPLRLRSLFRSAQDDQELDDEVRDRLERKTEEYLAQGLTQQGERQLIGRVAVMVNEVRMSGKRLVVSLTRHLVLSCAHPWPLPRGLSRLKPRHVLRRATGPGDLQGNRRRREQPSVNTIKVLDGLKEGDTVIISDMSSVANAERVRLADEKHPRSH